VDGFTRDVLPLFSPGASPAMRPEVDTVFDMQDAGKAHARMEANLNTGKIVLRIRDEQKNSKDEL